MEEIRVQQLEQFIDIKKKQSMEERIEESLQQIVDGKTKTHIEVMKMFEDRIR